MCVLTLNSFMELGASSFSTSTILPRTGTRNLGLRPAHASALHWLPAYSLSLEDKLASAYLFHHHLSSSGRLSSRSSFPQVFCDLIPSQPITETRLLFDINLWCGSPAGIDRCTSIMRCSLPGSAYICFQYPSIGVRLVDFPLQVGQSRVDGVASSRNQTS